MNLKVNVYKAFSNFKVKKSITNKFYTDFTSFFNILMAQSPPELEIPLADLSKEGDSKVDSQRSQNQNNEGEGLFDFTAPKDPKTNPLPNQESSNQTQQAFLVEIEEEEEKDIEQQKEDLDTVVKDLIKGARDPTTVSDESRPAVIASLQKIRDDHLFDHKVDLAQRAHELVTTLQNLNTLAYKQKLQREAEEIINNRLENAQNEFQKLQERCNRTMRLLKQKHRKDMEQLEERHINEMNEFVLKWQKPGTIRKYSSASSQLRNLRNQSIAMIVTRRFDDLRQTDKIVKSLEQQERNEQFRQMSMGYDFQFHQLEEKHKTEKSLLTSQIERKEAELKAAIDWEIKCATNRINSLQNSLIAAKDVDKVWNLHNRNKKAPTQKSLTTSNLSKTALLNRVDQFSLNTVDLPPLGDPRKTHHGFRRRMQAPVMLVK